MQMKYQLGTDVSTRPALIFVTKKSLLTHNLAFHKPFATAFVFPCSHSFYVYDRFAKIKKTVCRYESKKIREIKKTLGLRNKVREEFTADACLS